MFSLIFLCVYSSKLHANTAKDDQQEIYKYTENLIKQTYLMMNNPNKTLKDRVNESSEIMKSHLDLKIMSRRTLGLYYKELSYDQKKRFLDAYSNFVINGYAALVKSYEKQKGVVKQVRKLRHNLFLVSTYILDNEYNIGTSTDKIKVDYLVRINKDNEYKVMDVITENISIVNTQKSEFEEMLKKYNNDYNKFIDALNTHANLN